MPKLSITMLVLNAIQATHDAVNSILDHTKDFELLILNNGSRPRVKEWLINFKMNNSEVVRLFHFPNNVGFIHGHNYLIDRTIGKFICVMNNDVIVTKNWSEPMIEALEKNERIAQVGPVQRHGHLREHDFVGVPRFSKSLDYLAGHCFIIPRRIYKIFGLFDDKCLSLCYGEDSDFSLRLQSAGYEIKEIKESIVHHNGRGTKAEDLDFDRDEIEKKNREILMERWKYFLPRLHEREFQV